MQKKSNRECYKKTSYQFMEQLENIIFSLSDENIGAAIQSTLNLYDVRFSFSYNLIVSQLVYSSFVSFVNNESRCFLYLIGINEKEKEKKKIINIFYWYLLRLQSQESKFLLEKMLEQNMIDEIEKKNDNSFSHQNLSDQTNKSKNTQKSSKDESELNKKQTHEGVNQSIVAKAIRNDEIEKLQEISTETNFNFNQIIEPSHYEKCTYVNKENVSLIDYAAFFGSIKCFKYLLLNNSNIANAGKYAIAGGNSEIIHLCEQNHSSFEDAYEIAIEFHRNDIFHYLYENNIIEIKDKIKLGKKCIKYNNYELFSFLEKEGMKINDSLINEAARNGNIFLTLCFLEENKLPDNILVSSAESGNIELFKYILEQEGIDINVKNKHGRTALMMASEKNDTEIVKLLLELKGIDVNAKDNEGETALIIASSKGNIETIKLLLQHKKTDINLKNKEGTTPLMLSCISGANDIVRLLLDQKGIDVNLKNKNGWTSIMLACRYNHIEIVKMLVLKKGIDVNLKNFNNWTALMYACNNSNPDMIKLLLEKKGIDLSTKNNGGSMALMWACSNDQLEIVQLLIERKVSVNVKDIYLYLFNVSLYFFMFQNYIWCIFILFKTALMYACTKENIPIIKLLLSQKGIDINATDNNTGWTALIYACSIGNTQVVELLLEQKGIDTNIRGNDGRTALMWASKFGYEDIVNLILEKEKIVNQT